MTEAAVLELPASDNKTKDLYMGLSYRNTEMAYTKEHLESFISALKEASNIISEKNPDFLMVPVNGGVPLFDALCIIDRDIDSDLAVYFPTSSRVKNCSKVITRCWKNFLREKEGETDKPRTILSLDEVVTGKSVNRLLNTYQKASRELAKEHLGKVCLEKIGEEAEKIRGILHYEIIGLEEDRGKKTSDKTKAYKEYVESGIIHPISLTKIITMDESEYHTPRFDHPNTSGFHGEMYFPRIKEFVVTEKYLNLLKEIAMFVGVDPTTVGPKNLEKIREDCAKYTQK